MAKHIIVDNCNSYFLSVYVYESPDEYQAKSIQCFAVFTSCLLLLSFVKEVEFDIGQCEQDRNVVTLKLLFAC